MPLYVVIIDDEPEFSHLLKKVLETEDMRVSVFTSGVEALEKIAPANMPDIILMDINMPEISGIDLTAILKDRYPGIDIIVQSVMEDSDSIIRAIRAGASGYILKATPLDEVLESIKVVRQGGSFLTGKVARKVLVEFKNAPISRKNEPAEQFDLTQREEEVLRSLVQGKSYKEISHEHGISIHTVNNHIRRIYEKMSVNSRGEAVAKAMARINSGR